MENNGSVAKFSRLGEAAGLCKMQAFVLEGEALVLKIVFKGTHFPKV